MIRNKYPHLQAKIVSHRLVLFQKICFVIRGKLVICIQDFSQVHEVYNHELPDYHVSKPAMIYAFESL